jgi:hypothetical protein
MPAPSVAMGPMIAARIFLVALGVAALAWGVLALPAAWKQAPLHRLATQIIAAEGFKTEALIERARASDAGDEAYCQAKTLRSIAVIRLRVLEDALGRGQRDMIDRNTEELRAALRRSLGCAPADSFLWLLLFWSENASRGFSLDNLKYLRMSYRYGPHEGWIALKRNHLALALFEQLPVELAEMAISEFVRLLQNGFHQDAVAIFTGPGWRLRETLLTRLNSVDERHRRIFANILHERGYDVAVPGIKSPTR